MLSLVGSIQPDPFNPEHVPRPTVTMAAAPSSKRGAQPRPSSLPDTAAQSEREVDDLMEELEGGDQSGSDEDPFQKLGRMGDDEERRLREEALAAEAEKAKKRKRKERKARKEGDGGDGAAKKSKKS